MTISLNIAIREGSGKKAARKLRHEGFIPGIVYGDDKEPVLISIGEKELLASCYSLAFLGHILDVKLGSVNEKILPREIVFHPVTDRPMHVDFQRISKNSKIKVHIAVEFENEDKSPGMKKGGVINFVVHQLECLCPSDSIPERIVLDLSGKEIGDNFTLDDVKLPKGVEPTNPERDHVLAAIAGARVAKADDTESSSEEATEETAA